MTELAQLLRRRRLELGLTQRAAAQLASLSLATWQSLERPTSSMDSFQDLTLARVARGLHLDLPAIFHTAGRALPDPQSLPDDPHPTGEALEPADTEQLLAHLAERLRALARTAPESFLIVYSQAAETAQHLLELRGDNGE